MSGPAWDGAREWEQKEADEEAEEKEKKDADYEEEEEGDATPGTESGSVRASMEDWLDRQLTEEQGRSSGGSNRAWQPPRSEIREESRPAPVSILETRKAPVQAAGGAGSPLMQKIREKKTAQQNRREVFLKKAQAEFDQREY